MNLPHGTGIVVEGPTHTTLRSIAILAGMADQPNPEPTASPGSLAPTAVESFVADWLRHWNEHDVEGVLSHFADDVVFTSPHARLLLPDSDGVVRGKDALRAYWRVGIERNPDLHFELLGVYTGVSTIVINYRNHKGTLASEVLVLDGATVVEGHGTYIEG